MDQCMHAAAAVLLVMLLLLVILSTCDATTTCDLLKSPLSPKVLIIVLVENGAFLGQEN